MKEIDDDVLLCDLIAGEGSCLCFNSPPQNELPTSLNDWPGSKRLIAISYQDCLSSCCAGGSDGFIWHGNFYRCSKQSWKD